MKYKHVENYLNYCQYQKRLTGKTLKAYRIDLNQFYTYMQFKNLKNKKDISVYIQQLHTTYKPRTVKRKIAAIKAFYTYLEKQDFLKENPFHKIDYRFKEPIRLPKTITLHELNHLYQSLYAYSKQTSNRVITRDIAILELLICTGIRVSEVSHLLKSNVFIRENTIIINGKGSKERIIYIDNQNLIQSLLSYQRLFQDEIEKSPYFFINRLGHHLSEQSIRFMIVKYCHLFHIDSQQPRFILICQHINKKKLCPTKIHVIKFIITFHDSDYLGLFQEFLTHVVLLSYDQILHDNDDLKLIYHHYLRSFGDDILFVFYILQHASH